jgi:hypothetical protein
MEKLFLSRDIGVNKNVIVATLAFSPHTLIALLSGAIRVCGEKY